MDADELRMMAQRCRELLRVATDDQVRAQLREWADDLEEEADTAEIAATQNRRGAGWRGPLI